MIRGENILCFAPDPWSDIWRNRHRLLSIFARHNRVVYVEPRTDVRSLARGIRKGEIGPRDLLPRPVEEVRENLFVYHDPVFLPRTGKPGLATAIDRFRDRRLQKVLNRLGVSAPILWLVRPNTHDVPGKFGEKLVMYQIVDDYSSFAGVTNRQRAEHFERLTLDRADLVVVTSQQLLEAKRDLHPNVSLVCNAVDSATLEAGATLGGPLPAELSSCSHPIAGYIGGVTEKVDLEMLAEVARSLLGRGGTLVFVGPVRLNSTRDRELESRLRALSNVVFVGKKDPQDVPAYLRAMDVCLIPYRTGAQALAIDPLKLYEYLAFGKPTVAVDIPSVRPYAEVLSIAESSEQFPALVEKAAQEGDSPEVAGELARRRRQLASENTWEARVEELSSLFEDVLATRNVPV